MTAITYRDAVTRGIAQEMSRAGHAVEEERVLDDLLDDLATG